MKRSIEMATDFQLRQKPLKQNIVFKLQNVRIKRKITQRIAFFFHQIAHNYEQFYDHKLIPLDAVTFELSRAKLTL